MENEKQDLNKTDPFSSPFEEWDEPSSQPEKGINILREKTFNEDLKKLVSRIKENEEPAKVHYMAPEDLGFLSDDELLAALHLLFYSLKNDEEAKETAAFYDPFLDTGDVFNESPDYWKEILISRITALEFHYFALLEYDFSKKAYVPSRASQDVDRDNFAISLKDGLYRSISTSPKGHILLSSDIEIDQFLSKALRFAEKSEYSLYFINSSFITAPLLKRTADTSCEFSAGLDSAILMLKYHEGEIMPSPEDLHATLKQNLAIPLLLALDARPANLETLDLNDVDNKIAFIEYLLLQYSSVGDNLCAVITAENNYNKEIGFIIKYLIAKLRKGLGNYSTIIQTSQSAIMVLTKQKDAAIIDALMSDNNRYYHDIFQVQYHGNRDFPDTTSIINRLFMS
ncbi:MAG TPA: hypothetical protein PK926_13325 [Spirochaetota bacterium]|nr:hypothetical protein [Spirochaetota bacterium]HPI90922.1 hypothetical protein [Spirochaetota bacterium]HPR48394.1 hypothetical protein [Spirochaetota bacterium]